MAFSAFLQKPSSPKAIIVIVAAVVIMIGAGVTYRIYGVKNAADGTAQQYALRGDVWNQLLKEVQNQKDGRYATTIEESGLTFDIVASVPAEGPTLRIRGRGAADAAIEMIDTDTDQSPDLLRVTQAGETEPNIVKVADIVKTDRDQFIIGWAMAWGKIAEEFQKAAADQYGLGGVTVESQPVR